MNILWYAADIVLAGFVVREVIRFGPIYRGLKRAIENGDLQARTRVYRQAIRFEWASAALAFVGLGFDWHKLTPRLLGLNKMPLVHLGSRGAAFERGGLIGMIFGIALGTIVLVIARLRANRQAIKPVQTDRWWRNLVPDFFALMPSTAHERVLFAAVAISAGICEEIVFRGWLLSTLHGLLALHGIALIVAAAIAFGFAHAYQGTSGVLLTTFAGVFFCYIYIATGSLLIPIFLHVVIDLRFAFLPGARIPSRPTQAAKEGLQSA